MPRPFSLRCRPALALLLARYMRWACPTNHGNQGYFEAYGGALPVGPAHRQGLRQRGPREARQLLLSRDGWVKRVRSKKLARRYQSGAQNFLRMFGYRSDVRL